MICENCPFFIGEICTDDMDGYINKETGLSICRYNPNAILREEGKVTEAQEFEGKWVLEGTVTGEGAVLVVDRYGLRIVWGFHDEEGTLHIPSHQGSPPYLPSKAVSHLRELIAGAWMCECLHWAKGEGYCPWCGAEHESSKD